MVERRERKKVWILLLFVCIYVCISTTKVMAKDEEVTSYQGLVVAGSVQLFCKVDGGKNPVVVLDAAYGKDHMWTDDLADNLRKTRRVDVFQYDRAGLGMSGTTKALRTPINKAQELHSLLSSRGITKFYYVGYALSGLTIREYAYLYPNEILGTIMLDCASEDQVEGIDVFLNSVDKTLAKSFKSNFKKEDGTYTDLKEGIKQIKEINKYDSFRNIPLTVISGDYHGFGDILRLYNLDKKKSVEMENKWNEWQDNLTKLSNNSNRVVLDVYSYFQRKTEVGYVLKMLGVEFNEKDYVAEPLFFSEGVYGNNLPLFRFFAFISDGLGW